MRFEKYHLSEDLLNNLQKMRFFRTTDIQYKAIGSILKGEDLLAIAQTGTGKTAAFAIPIIELLHKEKSSKRSRGIQCLVMVPTRELAQQIGKVFQSLSRHTKVKSFALYGGVEQERQILKLQEGLDVLITTPGRMFDLISQQALDVSQVRYFVLDEADHMLDLGFIEDIRSIKKKLKQRHQSLFFSATINDEIKKLAYSMVKSNAIRIQLSPKDPVSKNVSHFLAMVEMDDKRHFLKNYIQQHPDDPMIIFVRTRVRSERVSLSLSKSGITCRSINGQMEQEERDEALEGFRNKDFKVLIATDLTARGIDVAGVKHVINYDLPDKAPNYVHRVGRTGRGFEKGVALSFCSHEEKEKLERIESLLGHKIERIRVSEDEYEEIIEAPVEEYMDLIAQEELRLQKIKKRKKN